MAFVDQLAVAVQGAPRHQLDNLARLVWRAHAEGQLGDDEAQNLAEAIQLRRILPAPEMPRPRASSGSRPRKPESIARRRAWAASGLVPARIASSFTPGQVAVLSLIAAEVKKRGSCTLFVATIAAQAGCCATVVRQALRHAVTLGLLDVRERRQSAWRSDSNVVVIRSTEWTAWLRLRPRGIRPAGHGGGCISVLTTPTEIEKGPRGHHARPPIRGNRGRAGPPERSSSA